MIDELLAQLIFSKSGKEIRTTYTSVGSPAQNVIEYVGVTNAVNAPTSAEVWYITKLEYNGDGCLSRVRSLSVQKKWDDRASLFP